MFIIQNLEDSKVFFKTDHHSLSHITEITVVNILAYFFPLFFLYTVIFVLIFFPHKGHQTDR